MSLNIGYSIKEGLAGLKRAKFATSITISTVGVSMLLLGFFLIFTINLNQIVDRVRDYVSMEVFVQGGLDTNALTSLQSQILQIPGIVDVSYISPEQALLRFEKDFGEDPLAILGENPLPGSLEIQLASTHRKSKDIESVATRVKTIKYVDEVIYHSSLIQTIDRYSRIIIIIDGILFVIILMASILLISNTLRLIIYAQKEIIEIMGLVGATRKFIRRPYLIQGFVQGGLGGLLACGLLWVCAHLFAMAFPQIMQIPAYYYAVLSLFSLFIGYLGSWFGLHRFLRI